MRRYTMVLALGLAFLASMAVNADPVVPVHPTPPPPPTPAPAAAPVPGSHIQFQEPVYDFGRVRNGELVKHVYNFTNTGNAVLEVTHVQPSCGCTTAGDFTHTVEPGQSGTIAVQFNSANFGGPVFKTVTVTCNDKTQPTVMLQLKGTVWKPIEVTPQFAVLNVTPDGQPASTVVKIVNNTDEKLEITSGPDSNNKAFKAEIHKTPNPKETEVMVTTVPPLTPGNVQGQITLKTSSTNMPVVTINAWANVQPAITVIPPQITLPPAPLQTKFSPAPINIQNNSSKPFVVSNATINAEGVDVQLREINTGRTFAAALTFPESFEVKLGQPIILTMKTSSEQMPEIKIPVLQMPRPVAPPAPPAAPVVPVPPPPRPSVSAGH